MFTLMSFADAFNERWRTVIEPAIRDDAGAGLEPYRVDIPRTAGSIPTEIVTGIAEARLVFADVSIVERWTKDDGSPGWMRNGNVMYEVGIAHAVRQPEEVILFRSDNEPLLFDVAALRVNPYDPDADPAEARRRVAEAVQSALREVNVARALAIRRAAAALSAADFVCLMDAVVPGGLPPQNLRTLQEYVAGAPRAVSIARLLEMGLLSTSWGRLTSAPPILDAAASWHDLFEHLGVRYHATEMGHAVVEHVGRGWNIEAFAEELGFNAPDAHERFGFPRRANNPPRAAGDEGRRA